MLTEKRALVNYQNPFVLSYDHRELIKEYALSVFDIKDYKGDGIVINAESVIAKIEKSCNDILFNNGKKTEILQAGNGKIDDSVLCQAIFPVITCPCHCIGCYAVNACTKKFNGIGKQTAEAWFKWFFIERYYPDIYFLQVDRELTATNKTECRWHVSGDFIDNDDVVHCIKLFRKHSNKKFYTYTKRDTKRHNMPALPELLALDNVNVVDSLPCGMKNYGNSEYLEKLVKTVFEKTGENVVICKCGTTVEKEYNKAHKATDKKKYCGGECKACRDCKYIAFIEHK